MSANTDYYWNKIQNLEANPVAEYQSKYGTQIDSVLDKIVNREAFSYDFNADPLYQNYKDQYTKLGNEASMNAVANASALTGGYGNSYAVTAGAQANQQYLTQLNNIIPELYNAAMNKYQMEGDQLNNQYSVLGDAEDREYGKYRDTVSDYFNSLNYYQGAYGTQLGNDQWNAEFNYQKQRDAVSDAQWQAEYALKQASAASKAAASTASQYDGSDTNPVKSGYTQNDVNGGKDYSNMNARDFQNYANITASLYPDTGSAANNAYNEALNAYNSNYGADKMPDSVGKDERVANLLAAKVDRGEITETEALDILKRVLNGDEYSALNPFYVASGELSIQVSKAASNVKNKK